MFNHILINHFYKKLEDIHCGTLTLTTPDGQIRSFEGQQPGQKADILIHNWYVIPHMARKGDIGFAEDYRLENWTTTDLTALLIFALENQDVFAKFIHGHKFSQLLSWLSSQLRMNTLSGSKKNIHAHYDLGNQFYKLWLDPSMTYSAALYNKGDETLSEAQDNKYDRILAGLDKSSGTMLEIGCGWGGFAERAIAQGDYDIKGITLSEEQHIYAQQRLQHKALINLEDYRHQRGKFDHIVSIEMFEAVGERYWPTYFNTLKGLLQYKGKAMIQTITMDESCFSHYRQSGDFIRTYIFPGGMLPSSSRFNEEASQAGLKAGNHFYFGQDYARTLENWLVRFDQNVMRVKALGFDDGFIRLWRFYLAACIAGFKTGRTNVMQVELCHA